MRNPNIKIDIGLIPSSRMAFPAVLVELVFFATIHNKRRGDVSAIASL